MWAFLFATLSAMQTTDPAEVKACWERAKARAAVEEHFQDKIRRGTMTRADHDEYLRQRLRLASPKERADVLAVLERRHAEMEQKAREIQRRLDQIDKTREERTGKKPPVGPPPPPDLK